MAFFFFDYAKMASAFDKFDKDVKAAIRDINGGCKTSLTWEPSARSLTSKFIPDYLINREGKPFLIIEYKSQLSSLSESIFAKGLSEWGTYGILTDGKRFKVYGRKSYSEIKVCEDLKTAIKYLLGGRKDVSGSTISEKVNYVCDFIIVLAKKHLKDVCQNKIIKLAEEWKKSPERFYEVEGDTYVLNAEAELSLIKSLLGKCNKGDTLFRYCSFRSLFRTLTSGKFYLNNIMNMNDKTEGAYFDDALANKIEYFLMSCSSKDKEDDFDMWRLYGDDTRGCCLRLKIVDESNPDFIILPVNYGSEGGYHPEMSFIKDLTSKKMSDGQKVILKNINEWKLFFKPYEYHNEKEIRILHHRNLNATQIEENYFFNEQYDIATKCLAYDFAKFPVVLDGITLGPSFPEKEANVAMLEELLRRVIDRTINISESKHKSYRALK